MKKVIVINWGTSCVELPQRLLRVLEVTLGYLFTKDSSPLRPTSWAVGPTQGAVEDVSSVVFAEINIIIVPMDSSAEGEECHSKNAEILAGLHEKQWYLKAHYPVF